MLKKTVSCSIWRHPIVKNLNENPIKKICQIPENPRKSRTTLKKKYSFLKNKPTNSDKISDKMAADELASWLSDGRDGNKGEKQITCIHIRCCRRIRPRSIPCSGFWVGAPGSIRTTTADPRDTPARWSERRRPLQSNGRTPLHDCLRLSTSISINKISLSFHSN